MRYKVICLGLDSQVYTHDWVSSYDTAFGIGEYWVEKWPHDIVMLVEES